MIAQLGLMMSVDQLDNNHYMFGNKGAVWSNKVHIAKSGDAVTLCGTPMLSSNHAKYEGVEHIGCPSCLAKYHNLGQAQPWSYIYGIKIITMIILKILGVLVITFVIVMLVIIIDDKLN